MTPTFSLKSFTSAARLAFIYCLPAMLAIAFVLFNYHTRTEEVAAFIDTQHQRIERIIKQAREDMNSSGNNGNLAVNSPALLDAVKKKLEFDNSTQTMKRLYEFILRQEQLEDDKAVDRESLRIDDIQKRIDKLWRGNALVIAILTLLPFLLLAMPLGFSGKLQAPYEVRAALCNKSWLMKFMVALIITFSWVYILNPSGQGDGTLRLYLIKLDLTQTDSLPIFLKGEALQPIIAGFLGWYLYLLTYFFSKVFRNDVLSGNVYGLMLQKFLLTYGITLILPSLHAAAAGDALATDSNLNLTVATAFMIGFFPMAAFSMLKTTGIKLLQGGNSTEEGQLCELPGISPWQIQRLEEEGINSMGTLASLNLGGELSRTTPCMGNLTSYWTDIARLYTIVGQDTYQKISKHCRTASEFVSKAGDEKFVAALAADDIINADEIARDIKRTFPTDIWPKTTSEVTQG